MPAEKKKEKGKSDEPEVCKGVYIFPNGDKYDGFYIQTSGSQERCGTGTNYFMDGIVYEGQWENDKMNGKGKLLHPSGATYEGDFVDNKFHGTGKYLWPNGSYYEGQFSENRMEGEGQFTDTEGQNWTGTFRFKAAPGLRFKLNFID